MSKLYICKEVVEMLIGEGWVKARVLGSQGQFVHPKKLETIILPEDGNKIISPTMLKDIFNKSMVGLHRREGNKGLKEKNQRC